LQLRGHANRTGVIAPPLAPPLVAPPLAPPLVAPPLAPSLVAPPLAPPLVAPVTFVGALMVFRTGQSARGTSSSTSSSLTIVCGLSLAAIVANRPPSATGTLKT
jgi:hypothetical protein